MHRTIPRLANAAAALLLAGCRASDAPAPPVAQAGTQATASPSEMHNARRYAAAMEGLRFRGGLVEVEEPRPDAALASERLQEARALALGGDHYAAMAAYAGAIRAAPQDPAAYDGLGELLRLTGRSDESMAAWRTALALDPAFVDARFHLAVALWSASRRGEAISEMERLVVQRPEHGRAHAQLARWHFYGGDREAALRHLQAAQAAGTPLPPRLLDALDAGR